jgi:hypothetical protein
MNEYTKLFTGSALIIKGLTVFLEENDIQYIIKDRLNSALIAGFGELPNTTEVHVKTFKLDVANEILENYRITINL